jgi:hypothetical protein
MALCDEWTKARANGVKTPQIAFMLPFAATDGGKQAAEEIYEDLYKPGTYSDLFFRWKGKPLMMAYSSNLKTEVQNYFTFRPGQDVYNKGPSGDTRTTQWGWLEIYPQHEFPYNGHEQVTVGVAQNWSKAAGLTAMNAPNVFGRSYTNQNGHNNTPGAVNYGYNFQEQWNKALQLNPEFIFITGWNEWIVQRYTEWGGVTNSFPDQFSQECSRDIEPMKDGHGDNYYMQMASNIRHFKGMSAPATASGEYTIVVDGQFDDWDEVAYEYSTHKGSAGHRNSPGWQGVSYTNTTGRNDFVAAKVALGKDCIYFYVETAQAITSSSGNAWMRLFLNTDRNRDTGWEGYDFIVNRTTPNGSKAVVERNTGGWNWETVGEANFKVSGNKLEMRIPYSILQLSGKLNIEFKWSDNMQEAGNLMDFYVNGDVAPSGRFNYVFKE